MNLMNTGTPSALLYILKILCAFEICRLNDLHLPVTFSTYLPFQSEPGQTPADRAVKPSVHPLLPASKSTVQISPVYKKHKVISLHQ